MYTMNHLIVTSVHFTVQYLHYVILSCFINIEGLSKGYSRWGTVAPPINLWENALLDKNGTQKMVSLRKQDH